MRKLNIEHCSNCRRVARRYSRGRCPACYEHFRRTGSERLDIRRTHPQLKEHMWLYVNRFAAGCWNWKGSCDEKGYGMFQFSGNRVHTHRLAYELVFGEIPSGLCVCHKCDNPGCCRPDHLFLGTHSDNMQDMVAKGRNAVRQGGKHSMAKLTAIQVEEIRELCRKGYLQKEIASRFGVSAPTVSAIHNGRLWRSLKRPYSDTARTI